MKPRFPAVLVACTLLVACPGHHDGPSDARMSQQITRQFNQEFGDSLVRVKNLRQSQGHITAKGHYIALVHFDIRFTKGLAEVRKQDGDAQAMELSVLFGNFSAGDSKSMTDEVLFRKTDRGWVLINSRQEE